MTETIEAYVKRVVDRAPPLSAEQRDRLAAILQPERARGAALIHPTPAMEKAKPTGLYRYYDVDETLLYIGITVNDSARDIQHASSAYWYRFVATRIDGEIFAERDDAETAEEAAIKHELPVFNVIYNAEGYRREIGYLIEHDAWDVLTIRNLNLRTGTQDVIRELYATYQHHSIVINRVRTDKTR